MVVRPDHVLVEWRVGERYHRVRTFGPPDAARREAERCGLQVTRVAYVGEHDRSLPFVYDLQEWIQ